MSQSLRAVRLVSGLPRDILKEAQLYVWLLSVGRLRGIESYETTRNALPALQADYWQ
jgi:hypothetical protein